MESEDLAGEAWDPELEPGVVRVSERRPRSGEKAAAPTTLWVAWAEKPEVLPRTR